MEIYYFPQQVASVWSFVADQIYECGRILLTLGYLIDYLPFVLDFFLQFIPSLKPHYI